MTTGKGVGIENGGKCAGNATPYFVAEAARRKLIQKKRRAWLTFVIVGGGPTGVNSRCDRRTRLQQPEE